MSRLGNAVRGRRDDEGFTLVELLVAMGIFSVLLAIFAAAVTSFSRTTLRTSQTSDQTSQARTAMDLFDRGLRSASEINRPVLVGSNWYVEYRSDAVLPNTCTQWVLRTAPGTQVLARRTWVTDVATPTPSAWRTVATNVVNTNDPAADAARRIDPFSFEWATPAIPRQRLAVRLRVQQGSGPLTRYDSTFAARNTSTLTRTNPDANTDNHSDYEVCQDITGARP
jgi:prepilin-type N-terminal cleavage/methylation domain-containing protein